MIFLGLDLGSKTCGISISDKTALIASSIEVIRYNTKDELMDKLNIIVNQRNVDAFVLGDPKNLDGSVSDRSKITYEFKHVLEEKFNKQVFMQDERLSTIQAQKMLISNDTTRKKRKKIIDKIAATIILQSFLDRRNNER